MSPLSIVGVDFDNTIVCYDAIFHRIAVERGLVPADLPANKTAVRDYLRQEGREPDWTELQGVVYGPRMTEAGAFPGVKEFFRECRWRGIAVKIVSHKTRFPYAGERHDLHASALNWLEQQGFFATDDIGLSTESVFFEPSKQGKMARISALGCRVFIDDLPEFLNEPDFPAAVRRVLFDPSGAPATGNGIETAASWTEVIRKIFSTFDEPADAGLADVEALFHRADRRLGGVPVRLAGGGNNRVFEARSDAHEWFLLKHYFNRPAAPRNGLEAERLFYRLAAETVPNRTPKAFAWDPVKRLGLLEFIEGAPLSEGRIDVGDVQAALDFFSALNHGRSSREAVALPLAAEACFTLEEHCRTVDRRLVRLGKFSPESPVEFEARNFVSGELADLWRQVRSLLAANESEQPLPVGERCVSPSDFGFHNCLRRADASLVFFDFEYAGWDDPAKTVCDFFCQPAVPAPPASFEMFAAGVARAVGHTRPAEFVVRCRLLLPVYQVKWCTILLNEFVPVDRERRAFAIGEGVLESRKARQLSAARRACLACRQGLHGTAP